MQRATKRKPVKKMPAIFPTEVLSPRAAAAFLGLHVTTLWRMRRAGDFPAPIELSIQRIGWRRADLERWLASRPKRHAS